MTATRPMLGSPSTASSPGCSVSPMRRGRDRVDAHVLKRYEVGSVVGKGAYGIVWKAVDKKTMQTVALKKIFDGFQNITDAQRTYREVMLLQMLRHDNIIRLLNVVRSVNHVDLYLVFENMDTDLHAVIRAGILEPVHKQYILYQLLKVLKYLHSASIVHRDIKPSNMLLNAECHLKLADFGLARMVDPSNNQHEVPILTDYVATRWYRAPEILLGSNRYTTNVDIWSAGCILGELLLSNPLFPGRSTMDQVSRIIESVGLPSEADLQHVQTVYADSMLRSASISSHSRRGNIAERLPPDTSSEAIDLLRKLLQFNPANRITAADALEHPYLKLFHNPRTEPICSVEINLGLNDNRKQTIETYRSNLYREVSKRRKKRAAQLASRRSAVHPRNAAPQGSHARPPLPASPPSPGSSSPSGSRRYRSTGHSSLLPRAQSAQDVGSPPSPRSVSSATRSTRVGPSPSELVAATVKASSSSSSGFLINGSVRSRVSSSALQGLRHDRHRRRRRRRPANLNRWGSDLDADADADAVPSSSSSPSRIRPRHSSARNGHQIPSYSSDPNSPSHSPSSFLSPEMASPSSSPTPSRRLKPIRRSSSRTSLPPSVPDEDEEMMSRVPRSPSGPLEPLNPRAHGSAPAFLRRPRLLSE